VADRVEPLSAYIKRVNGDRNEIPFIVGEVEKLEEVAEATAEQQARTLEALAKSEGAPDGPGVCKGLPMPPEPPLVELVVVDRFKGEAEAT
jgi:hypothetical protein